MKRRLLNKNTDAFTTLYTNNQECEALLSCMSYYYLCRGNVYRNKTQNMSQLANDLFIENKLVCDIEEKKMIMLLKKNKLEIMKIEKILQDHGWIKKYKDVVELGYFEIVDDYHNEYFYGQDGYCDCKKSTLSQLKDIELKQSKEMSKSRLKRNNNSEKSLDEPSKRNMYNRYKTKEIELWGCRDFFGLYLNRFVEHYNIEDPAFINKKEQYISRFYKQINEFVVNIFHGDNSKLRDYVNWVFDKYLSGKGNFIECITANLMFSQSSFLIKAYLFKDNSNIKKKKDNDYSSNDYVKNFLRSKS